MPSDKMISHEHKCIFVHQRKCAGTSIISSFGLKDDQPDWHYMNAGALSPEYRDRPLNYTIFSIVRNPWDRFVSGWLYCKNTRCHSLRHVLQHLPATNHDYEHVTRLQKDILFDYEGNIITHRLLRDESLQQNWNDLCDLIGKERATLPWLNQTSVNRAGYQEYFRDPIDRDLFMRHFGRDVETFEYEF
jgi:hypothetical protein